MSPFTAFIRTLILAGVVLIAATPQARAADDPATVGKMMDNFLIKAYYPLRSGVVAQVDKIDTEYKSKTNTVKVIGQMIAFVLLVYAFVKGMSTSTTPKDVMMLIAKMFILTGCIALIPTFMGLGNTMSESIASMMSGTDSVTNDSMVVKMLNDLKQASYAVQPPTSWLDIGTAISNALAFISMMCAFGAIALMDIVLLVLNLVRSLILTFSEIFLPVGIAMMAVGMLAGIGRTWIMSTIGVLLWPVGWGLVMVFVTPITQLLGEKMMSPDVQTGGVLVNFMVVLYILVAIGICFLWVAVTRVIGRAMQGSGDIAAPTIGAALSMPMKGASAAGQAAASVMAAKASGGATLAADAGRMAARAASRK